MFMHLHRLALAHTPDPRGSFCYCRARTLAALLITAIIGSFGSALLAALPIAQTQAATSLTSRSVTLNGYVSPNDWRGFAKFEYGLTSAYGTESSLISLSGAGNVSLNLTGLTPNTTYHFRVLCLNSYTTAAGSDMSFTTFGEPPAVETRPVSELTTNSATLNAYINPMGENAVAYFEYSTNTIYYFKTPATAFGSAPGTTTLALSPLTPGTTYHYRIAAANSHGTTYGTDVAFTTVAAPPGLQALRLAPDGFAVVLQTPGPGVYSLETSSDCLHWQLVASYTNPPPSFALTNAPPPQSAVRFYRAYRSP